MRNAFRRSLLACALLFPGAGATCAEPAPKPPERAAVPSDRADPNAATENLKATLEKGVPESQVSDPIAAKGKQAETYLAAGEFEKALEACNEALRLAPTNGASFGLRGRIQAALGHSNLAIQDCNEAIRLNPKDAEAFSIRGAQQMKKGDLDAAIRDFDESLKLDPKVSGVFNDRGIAWQRKGKLAETLHDFNEAIRLQPENYVAHRNRAAFYIARKNWEAALKDLDEAIDANPTSEDCRVRAYVYQNKGEPELAAFDLETAIKLDPNNAKAHYDRATRYANEGEWRPAVADLTRCSELSPKDVDCLNWLSRLLASCPDPAQRNGKQAVEVALKACELTEWKTAESVDVLAAAYARAGDFDAAVKFGKMALTLEGVADTERKRMERRIDYYRAHMAFVLNWKQ